MIARFIASTADPLMAISNWNLNVIEQQKRQFKSFLFECLPNNTPVCEFLNTTVYNAVTSHTAMCTSFAVHFIPPATYAISSHSIMTATVMRQPNNIVLPFLPNICWIYAKITRKNVIFSAAHKYLSHSLHLSKKFW